MSGDTEAARGGRFNQSAMQGRAYEQLVGLCRGVLVDGVLNDAEIVALDQWCSANVHLLAEWPGQMLARRVQQVLADGHVEEEERRDLKAFLERATGPADSETFDTPTSLPFESPEPHIEFEGRRFCLTGTFLYGPRARVEAAVRDMGGEPGATVARADYLVIGSTVSPAWKYGTHGRKIEDAVARRAQGSGLRIVSEAHWHTTLC